MNIEQNHVASLEINAVIPSERSCDSEGEGSDMCEDDSSNNGSDVEPQMHHSDAVIILKGSEVEKVKSHDTGLDQTDSTGVTNAQMDLKNNPQVVEGEGENDANDIEAKLKKKKKK